MQQELQTQVDQLPPARYQARKLHRTGGEDNHSPPGSPRQQVADNSMIHKTLRWQNPWKPSCSVSHRWAAIATYLPDRTDNDIKNHWNTHLKKKLKTLKSEYPPSPMSKEHAIGKGQWERRLQTDIEMAKQALSEALSAETPSFMSELLQPLSSSTSSSSSSNQNRAQLQSSTYAYSAENISRLLQEWGKAKPKAVMKGAFSPSGSKSDSTQHSSSNVSGELGADSLVGMEHEEDEGSKPPAFSFLETWLLDETLLDLPLIDTAELF